MNKTHAFDRAAKMKPQNAETRLVAGMIEDARAQAFIRRALGADKAFRAPPDLEFSRDYIRSMFVDVGVRDEFRFTFELLKVDPEQVDWRQIAESQLARHFPPERPQRVRALRSGQ
jgi:hypothetical protein